ncbi:MAG: hypothetical protein QM811_05940 [Pirellulales bacterium]
MPMPSNPYESPQDASKCGQPDVALKTVSPEDWQKTLRADLRAVRGLAILWEFNIFLGVAGRRAIEHQFGVWAFWFFGTLLAAIFICSIFRWRLFRKIYLFLQFVTGPIAGYLLIRLIVALAYDKWAIYLFVLIYVPCFVFWLVGFGVCWVKATVAALRPKGVFNEGPQINWADYGFEPPRFDLLIPRTRRRLDADGTDRRLGRVP